MEILLIAGVVIAIAVILYYSRERESSVQKPVIEGDESWKMLVEQAVLGRETKIRLEREQADAKWWQERTEAIRANSRCVVCGKVASKVVYESKTERNGDNYNETTGYWLIEGFEQCWRCKKWHCCQHRTSHLHKGNCEACWRKELGGLVRC